MGFLLTDAESSLPLLIGAVLTGGSSRRMGRNKALIEVDGVPMARRVANALRDAGCASVLAYGGDPDELAVLGLAVVADRFPGSGPLGGVLGVLGVAADQHGDALVLVAACDLPSLSPTTLTPMIEIARAERGADVVVARTSQIEPTCAIWRTSAAKSLSEMFDTGERALHVAIGALTTVEVAVDSAALRNINTPEELGGYP